MLAKYRTIPKVDEYFKLSANNGRNMYFEDRKKAFEVLRIYRNGVSNTEWILYHIKGDKITVLETIKKRDKIISEPTRIEEKKRDFSLEETLMYLANEENDLPKRR